MKLSEIKANPNNPRLIKDAKFEKLCKSIEDFPKMMSIRPIIVDNNNVILGGNMRFKALKHLGHKDIPDHWVKRADDLTEEQKKEFIIKDNVGFGEHNWDLLANEWDALDLEEWGLDLLFEVKPENEYTKKITAPTYEPKNEKPSIDILYDIDKTKDLINKIDSSSLDKGEKDFLKIAAQRHIVFNYENIADYYSHSSKESQELMEESALVIIDFNKAIELGYVRLSEEVAKKYSEDYDED
jgi:hypothetical protein